MCTSQVLTIVLLMSNTSEANCEPDDTVISGGPLIRALQLQSYVSGVNSVTDINMTGWDTVGTGLRLKFNLLLYALTIPNFLLFYTDNRHLL